MLLGFSRLMNFGRFLEGVLRWNLQFLLNHLYVLIAPFLVLLKFVYSVINEALDRAFEQLAAIDVGFMANVEGEYATVFDILEIVNYMAPLSELIGAVQGMLGLWSVALTLRAIKGIKQTVAF